MTRRELFEAMVGFLWLLFPKRCKPISIDVRPWNDFIRNNFVDESVNFNEIDKGTGLSGILYGMTDRQMRKPSVSVYCSWHTMPHTIKASR